MRVRWVELLFAATLGCGGTRGVARDQAAEDFHCNPNDVSMRELTEKTFLVSGCGRVAKYVCQRNPSGDVTCMREVTKDELAEPKE